MNYLDRLGLLASLTFLMACGSEPPAPMPSAAPPSADGGQSTVVDNESQKNIVGVAVGSKDHTTLVAAVKAALPAWHWETKEAEKCGYDLLFTHKTRGDIYTRDTLAWALHSAGRSAEARPLAESAIALGTHDARLLYHAGAIKLAAGDAEGGRALLRKALALNPKFDIGGAGEAAHLLAQ